MIWNTDTPQCATEFASCGSIFDSPRLKRELAAIEEKISDPAVWADGAKSQPLMRERKQGWMRRTRDWNYRHWS